MAEKVHAFLVNNLPQICEIRSGFGDGEGVGGLVWLNVVLKYIHKKRSIKIDMS